MKDENDKKTGDLIFRDAPKSVGRPRTHGTAADRQKAYRERLKKKGYRVVARVTKDVRDAEIPLTSEIIDLSAIRRP